MRRRSCCSTCWKYLVDNWEIKSLQIFSMSLDFCLCLVTRRLVIRLIRHNNLKSIILDTMWNNHQYWRWCCALQYDNSWPYLTSATITSNYMPSIFYSYSMLHLWRISSAKILRVWIEIMIFLISPTMVDYFIASHLVVATVWTV